jgi:hypothetical protein
VLIVNWLWIRALSNTLSSTVLEGSVLLANDTTTLGHVLCTFCTFWTNVFLSSSSIEGSENMGIFSSMLQWKHQNLKIFYWLLFQFAPHKGSHVTNKPVGTDLSYLVMVTCFCSLIGLIPYKFCNWYTRHSTAVLLSHGAVKVLLGFVSRTTIRLSWKYELHVHVAL